MANENNDGCSSCLGLTACVVFGGVTAGVFLAELIGSFTHGPIDLMRTSYNSLVGDSPIIKERLVDYVRRGIRHDVHKYERSESREEQLTESRLAKELGYNDNLPEGEKVDSSKIEMSVLWDAQEDQSRSFRQRWIWANLNDK